MKFSVVIATYKRADELGKTLESMSKLQRLPNATVDQREFALRVLS